MEIGFRLAQKKFKLAGARSLFLEYVSRISKFTSCQIVELPRRNKRLESGSKIWVCDREGRLASSEELAGQLEKIRDSGIKQLEILIGGAGGFSKEELDQLKPNFLWSFGPMTLPHELAAVIASEQIYRAFTLINHLPYHTGH